MVPSPLPRSPEGDIYLPRRADTPDEPNILRLDGRYLYATISGEHEVISLHGDRPRAAGRARSEMNGAYIVAWDGEITPT